MLACPPCGSCSWLPPGIAPCPVKSCSYIVPICLYQVFCRVSGIFLNPGIGLAPESGQTVGLNPFPLRIFATLKVEIKLSNWPVILNTAPLRNSAINRSPGRGLLEIYFLSEVFLPSVADSFHSDNLTALIVCRDTCPIVLSVLSPIQGTPFRWRYGKVICLLCLLPSATGNQGRLWSAPAYVKGDLPFAVGFIESELLT